jgi:hypothetical protein
MRNSLVTRMFTALARGEMEPQEPVRLAPAAVLSIDTETCLCLRCQATGEQDVIRFEAGMVWRVCRCCRAVCENGYETDYVLRDDGTVQNMSEVEQ